LVRSTLQKSRKSHVVCWDTPLAPTKSKSSDISSLFFKGHQSSIFIGKILCSIKLKSWRLAHLTPLRKAGGELPRTTPHHLSAQGATLGTLMSNLGRRTKIDYHPNFSLASEKAVE
jgi:hypothetical protein